MTPLKLALEDSAGVVGAQLGQRSNLNDVLHSRSQTGLDRGDFDFAMNGYEITPERKQKVLFSRPYYVYKLQLVVRDGDDRLHDYRDCLGRKDMQIGTLTGSETAVEDSNTGSGTISGGTIGSVGSTGSMTAGAVTAFRPGARSTAVLATLVPVAVALATAAWSGRCLLPRARPRAALPSGGISPKYPRSVSVSGACSAG